jgi:putative sigma-54 modulation protein
MRIELTGRHLTVTDSIREYAESKAAKLVKYFDGTQQINVLLEALKHSSFKVELVVDVRGHHDIIATATAPDLYAAIDLALDKARAQLTTFKERLKEGKR